MIRHSSSVDKNRLSRAGSHYPRIALYIPALERCTPRSQFMALPQLIKKRGLDQLQVVCAVMRKLLNAIHAMLENRTPCDSCRFYTPTETADNTT